MSRLALLRRALAALCLAAGVLQAVHAATEAPDGTRTWDFQVLLDGKPIGSHRFDVTTAGERTTVKSEAHFAVKLLGLTIYRYDHQDQEAWQGGCLRKMDSRTDDNGKTFTVNATADADGLRVKTGDGASPVLITVAGCTMGFAYWNPAMLKEKQLLNSQTGEYQAVVVGAPATDEVLARGVRQPARRYHLTGPENPLDLWYSPEGEWLGLESTMSGGRRLRYRLLP
ncbi:MAG: DUF6134 family protein [Pseudomonadota bacterium]